MKIKSLFITMLLLAAFTISCSEQKKEEVSEKIEMQADKQMSEHSISEAKSELVREGVIDVASIDINDDGKIYECPMDWNVLADEYHDCPVCGMKMKEYTLSEAKDNLIKYGHEVKE